MNGKRFGINAVFYNSPEWKATRRKVLMRAGYRCQLCGVSVAAKGASRVDHIITLQENPKLALDMSNLRVLCINCDAARHAEKGQRKVERETIALDGYPESLSPPR